MISDHEETKLEKNKASTRLDEVIQKEIDLSRNLIEFIKKNKDSYACYRTFPVEIKLEEQRAISLAETQKKAIDALIPQVSVLGENFESLSQQVTELTQHVATSQQKILKMKADHEVLEQSIGLTLKKYDEEMSTIEQTKEQLQKEVNQSRLRESFIFWGNKTARFKKFITAIQKNDLEIAKANYDSTMINHADSNGYTPLMLVIKQGHLSMMNWLLLKNADPNQAVNIDNMQNITPLMGMIIWQHTFQDIKIGLTLLISHQANTTVACDTYRFTPLHWAAYYGSKDAIDVLLKHSARKDAQDRAGRTACMVYSELHEVRSVIKSKKHKEITQLLKPTPQPRLSFRR